ncbi:unnamed protein product [Peronospora farinosa]|uniref:Uncharacterized protein n=1 Tax=Peronospora farinosa TaxID=134698 RepID=A0AAV0TTD6_9STRA|nr:unnamed protein product [Peronospora farinosa]CAI5726407.1 unnamed protein product [Peronospora farinosa]
MRGSGLSIERFIKGKAQRSKSDAKSKKKSIIYKAQRRRQYEKVKKCEKRSVSIGEDADKATGLTFYDRFFSDLKSSKEDEELKEVEARVEKCQDERVERKHVMKPDPFFKAKKKAAVTKVEKQRVYLDKQKRVQATEKKVTARKKRHVKLSQRTATGQPVVKNHIHDILSRLQAEKKQDDK